MIPSTLPASSCTIDLPDCDEPIWKQWEAIDEFLVLHNESVLTELQKEEYPPMNIAVCINDLALCQRVFSLGADLGLYDGFGRGPLHIAANPGFSVEIANFLLDQGVCIESVANLGQTALVIAVTNRQEEIVSCLLDRGANPNTADISGWTPLHYACGAGELEICQMLIKAGADLNKKNLGGETPLDIAHVCDQEDLINALTTPNQMLFLL